jgi:hypothetical protein
MTTLDPSSGHAAAQICLQCPMCDIISVIPDEESDLLLLGARVPIDSPQCQTRFIGEPQRVWTFFSNAMEDAS